MKKDIVVLYDGEDCRDGFSSAWVARKKFGNKASYIGVIHQAPIPAGIKNKDVYFFDFCYPKKIIEQLVKQNKKVIVVDHHLSSKEDAKAATSYVVDMKHSGAVLAWKYFYPKKQVPLFLRYVEDYDLWNFKLPGTRTLAVLLDTFKFKFDVWDKLVNSFENKKTLKRYMDEAKIMEIYEKSISNKFAEAADDVVFNGIEAKVANLPGMFRSEVANILVEKGAKLTIIWNKEGNVIHVSLRSKKGGPVDVSKLAEKYGGGGHQAAAGFRIFNGDPFPWKLIK
jgi:nanoRNase/pAp phosphatase (c-di-AMP/oligoRNAs hydrolase)